MKYYLAILLLLAVPVVGTAQETADVICTQCGMVNCTMPCCADANRAVDTPVNGVICEICGMVNCKMGCKAETVDWKGDTLMVMPGLPNWLFYASVIAVLVFSFVIVEVLGRRSKQQPLWRYNLFHLRPMKALFKSRFFPGLFQMIVTIFFLFLVYAGLYGHQVINITPALVWTIWWAGLIFIILFFGKAWCTICPWDFMATALSSLRLWGVGDRPLTLGLKWPRWMRNIYPAIGLFIILTWLELGYHVTTSPKMTAYMAIGMLLLAIIPAFIFDRKGFCRYGCFVGRISGLYANFSPIEVRSADKSVCAGCKTKDCYRGNENGNPCPTFLNLAMLEDNTYCIMCGDCVKSCPHDNVALNVRPFASDLFSYNQPRKDEAYLALILLSLTSFHGLTMTPIWENPEQPAGTIIGWISSLLGTGHLGSFTIGMSAILAIPIIVYWLFCLTARSIAQQWGNEVQRSIPLSKIFIAFAYSVLPIALCYHVAHNGMHLFMEGQNVLTLISDPMGRGWDLFGTATKTYPPILGAMTVWILQVILVVIGHIYGIIISQRTAEKLFGKDRVATWVQLPLLLAMILFSFISLWIMHLDMNMRGTLM